MKLRRVLVVYKKSAFHLYTLEKKDRKFIQLLVKNHVVTKRFVHSHEAHTGSLNLVREILRRRGINAHFIYRAKPFSDRSYDLVLSVGGDGTFLEASHGVFRRPLLGLNSNPADSVGMYCGATVETLDDILDAIEEGRAPLDEMTRLRVKLGKKVLPVPVVNDVLIAHSNPAGTTRYVLQLHGRREEQKSSGIWVSPPAGSTAAINAAGGIYMPISRRGFQYRVREPYIQPGRPCHHLGGALRPNDRIIVHSKLRAGRIFLDGPHLEYPFTIGERVEITAKAPVLRVYGFNETRRRKHFA